MGCDIHSIAQVTYDGKFWHAVGARIAGDIRSYATFALLANVRNDCDVPFFSEPRGLPWGKGPAELTCPCCHEGDVWLGDHSYSFFTLAELKKLAHETPESKWAGFTIKPEIQLKGILGTLELLREQHDVLDSEIRFVFGFDN